MRTNIQAKPSMAPYIPTYLIPSGTARKEIPMYSLITLANVYTKVEVLFFTSSFVKCLTEKYELSDLQCGLSGTLLICFLSTSECKVILPFGSWVIPFTSYSTSLNGAFGFLFNLCFGPPCLRLSEPSVGSSESSSSKSAYGS